MNPTIFKNKKNQSNQGVGMIRKLLGVFAVLFLIISFHAQNAKADLVEDLVREYKLDPKNNAKDQCDLMNELSKKTSIVNGGRCKNNHAFCCDKYGNICEASVITYGFDYDEQKFSYATPAYYSTSYADHSTYIFSLIYNKQQKKVLGASVRIQNGDDYLYDSNELLKDKNFTKKSKLWIDIRNHPEFKKAKLQNKEVFFLQNQEVNFDDGQLRFASPYSIGNKGDVLFDRNLAKDLSYIKIRGCYIEETNINFNNQKINHYDQ
ncbi:MAG: hypothetical protein V4612_06165 [Pseudomonadota bacterium]